MLVIVGRATSFLKLKCSYPLSLLQALVLGVFVLQRVCLTLKVQDTLTTPARLQARVPIAHVGEVF
jgi:hypothetical protein